MRRCCGLSSAAGGCFRKSLMSLPAVNEPPTPCTSTTRMASSLTASLSRSASVAYMLIISAFFFAGRLNETSRTVPERSVTMSPSEFMEPSPLSVGALHKGAEPRDRLADDQVLHLVGALVGIERFRIREEPRDVVVEDDTVPAEDLSSPGDRLPHPGGGKRLGQRRMMVPELAFRGELRRADDHALARRDVGEHLGEKVLNELERADGLSELHALLRVPDRMLVGAHLAPRRLPAHEIARHAEHPRGVAERRVGLEAVRLGHPAVVQRDLAVLDHLERDLVLNLFDAEAGRRLVLDDEALDLVVGDVARPDDRDITPRRVADPSLLAVEDPRVAFALRRRQQAATTARAHQRLGQAEAADLLHARHRRQPLLLLLFRPAEVDRAHRQPVVDAEEG